jgi:lysozyme
VRLDGIDVSHYQGQVDWPAVQAAGVWWAATKATQGTSNADPTLALNRAGMASAGIRHRGLYHWLSPGDPLPQAAWFLQNIAHLEPGEFVMIDAEEAGITAEGVNAWCAVVEGITCRPCAVYTGAYVAGGRIWAMCRNSAYGARPMVLAAYTSETKALALPGVSAFPWDAWQYSSAGPVPGVVGRCDMDRVDHVDVFDHAAGLDTAVVSPPVTADQADAISRYWGVTTMLVHNAETTIANNESGSPQGYGPGAVKWLVEPVAGSNPVTWAKHHLSWAEYAPVAGAPEGSLTNAQLVALPDV